MSGSPARRRSQATSTANDQTRRASPAPAIVALAAGGTIGARQTMRVTIWITQIALRRMLAGSGRSSHRHARPAPTKT